MNKTKKIGIWMLFVVILVSFMLLTGCSGGGGEAPCNGKLYDKPGEFGDGACISECGSSAECDRTKPGGKGRCEYGQICDNNCDCIWVDRDIDGYINNLSSLIDSSYELDCDDLNADVNPNATEKCNNKDDNCDGQIDEGDVCNKNVYVCKTGSFNNVSKSCSGGIFGNDSTDSTNAEITYNTSSEILGNKTFYSYVCDGNSDDGDYGCFYFVNGNFTVSEGSVARGISLNCGNNLIDHSLEDCDGSNINSKTCQEFGYTGGLLNCDNTCGFDFSNCQGNVCNSNNIKESGEECDGSDLNGRSCDSFGLRGGGLSCNSCEFNFSSCDCSNWGNCTSTEGSRTRICPSSDGVNIVGETQPCNPNSICGADDDSDNDGYYERNCWINSTGVYSETNGLDCNDNDADINPGMGEVCDGVDNDCDGTTDDGCSCSSGNTMICGSNEGVCNEGIQECVNGIWGVCGGTGYQGPSAENCDNSLDDNCDGYVNDGCACVDGTIQACGSNIGICQEGNQTCSNDAWGVCEGEVTAYSEICDDNLDNDCDTYVDDEDADCVVSGSAGGSSGGGTSFTETIPECGYGTITEKCKCGDKIYTRGYCYSGIYERSPRDEDGGTDGGETFISGDDGIIGEEKSLLWLWILLGILVVIGGGGVVFYILYKKGKISKNFLGNLFGKKKAKPAFGITSVGKISPGRNQSVMELVDYFDKSMKKEKTRSFLINNALKVGWRKSDIDAALKEVDARHKKFWPLIDHLKKNFGKNISKRKVKKDVMGAGWSKQDYKFAEKKAKKK